MLRFKLGPKRCLELGQANDLALVSYHLIQILKRGRNFFQTLPKVHPKDHSMVLTLSVALALIPGCGFGANPCESGWPHRVVIWPRALSSVCFFSSVHVCIVTWNSAMIVIQGRIVEAMMTWGVPKLSICWVVWVPTVWVCVWANWVKNTPDRTL